MILRQFEEAAWHWWGSDCNEAKPWNQDGEIVSPVEAVFEFGEVARHVLAADGTVSAGDRALDVTQDGVDPLERGAQRGLTSRSGDDRLMDAAGAADTGKAAQAVTDNGAGGSEIARCQGRDFGAAEPHHPAQFQADWLAPRGGFDRRPAGDLRGGRPGTFAALDGA